MCFSQLPCRRLAIGQVVENITQPLTWQFQRFATGTYKNRIQAQAGFRTKIHILDPMKSDFFVKLSLQIS